MVETRVQYHEELARLEARTLEGLDMVVETFDRTLVACQRGDLALAERVIADDDRIDGRYLEVHQSALGLLATQAPVAGDLRLIAALLHVIKSIERMGDQCVNVAKLLAVAGQRPPTGEAVVVLLEAMGAGVRRELLDSKRALAERDVELAHSLVEEDDAVDRLNRECFRAALRLGADPAAREWAMTMTLVARALERTGDYAVDIGEQVAFLVTGLFREFDDASHAGPEPL